MHIYTMMIHDCINIYTDVQDNSNSVLTPASHPAHILSRAGDVLIPSPGCLLSSASVALIKLGASFCPSFESF